jgi:putative ABC transport system substrate-binding protein
MSGTALAEDVGVWIALSESGGPYAEAAGALRDDLTASSPRRADVRVGPWQDMLAASGKPPQLVVTVGAAAFRGLIEDAQRGGALANVPVLAILVPRAFYESLSSKARAPTSAVFLDQPINRYLDLLRLAMPERKRIGVLLGPESAPLSAALAKAAAARGLQLITAQVGSDDELYPALRNVLTDAEVLLALPDARVFNTGSLQNILITTYRQRVPMVAFAPGYVRAGATLALYCSPAQAASQAAAAVRAFIGGRGLPAPQPAGDFSVAVNDRVARSLGLSVDDAAGLADSLRRQEAQR